MKIENHQFVNKPLIYFPSWKVNKIFLGTFNPENGTKVDYYYCREKNKFWNILLEKYNNKIIKNDFSSLKQFMIQNKFGCIDVIKSITYPESFESKIKNNYFDKNLFRVKGGFERIYIYERIQKYIIENNVKVVFTTWGKGKLNKEFEILNNHFRQFCNLYNIEFINLESCSFINSNFKGFDFIKTEWYRKIDKYFL
jgi:hypothetical protein